jgi:hypothetical protein
MLFSNDGTFTCASPLGGKQGEGSAVKQATVARGAGRAGIQTTGPRRTGPGSSQRLLQALAAAS